VRITFNDVSTREDVAKAIGELMALEDAFALLDGDLVAVKPDTAQPPIVPVNETPVPPEAPQAKEKRGRKKANTGPTPSANGHQPNETGPQSLFPEEEENIETAKERLRGIAKERGVLWLRPVLEAAGVKRLGELSDAKVRELARAAL
jgi:hypothetical protein